MRAELRVAAIVAAAVASGCAGPIAGTRTVKVRGHRYEAVVIRSTLRQAGFRFGSGTRTMYFAPGKGLVKLVMRHRDGSVSTVERVK